MTKILLLFVCLSVLTYSQWIPLNTSYGGTIQALAFCGDNLIAGTNGGDGIYISTNNGTKWLPSYAPWNTYPAILNVTSFAVKGDNIAAGFLGSGIYASRYAGVNFEYANYGCLTNRNINVLTIDSTNLFAGSDSGVFTASLNNYSWSHIGLNKKIMALVVKNNKIFAGSAEDGIYYSTNNGNNWFPVNTGLDNRKVLSLIIIENNIFAGTDSGIFISTNEGSSWNIVNSEVTSVKTFVANGNNIYAGSYDGILLSTDNGLSWSILNGLPGNRIGALACSGSKIMAGIGNEIFLSTDNGNSWNIKNINLASVPISSFYLSNENIYATTLYGLFNSTDSGLSWRPRNRDLDNTDIGGIVQKENKLFINSGLGMLFSTDEGETWHHVNDLTLGASRNALGVNNNTIYMSCSYGIYLTTNDGLSWKEINNGFPVIEDVTEFLFIEDKIFAATSGKGVFVTTNNGSQWIGANNGLVNQWGTAIVFNFEVKDNVIFAATVGGLFKTNNFGSNWTLIKISNLAYPVNSIALSGDNLFAAADDGIYWSSNYGSSWSNVSQGITFYQDIKLEVCGDYLLAGTYKNGIYRRPISEMITVIKEPDVASPEIFTLCQNYPNPFNPETRIKFTIPEGLNSEATFQIYDVLGKKIATLFNTTKPAGEYEEVFNASKYNIPSGVYFIKLSAGEFNSIKKMIYLK